MGHGPSSHNFQDYVSQILSEEPVVTLISEEIHSLTYEKFLTILGELNMLSKKCLDSDGKQLVFAVKKGTDSTLFWKATIQVACVKYDPQEQKIGSYRLLSLSEFLKVFKTFKCQASAEQASRHCSNSSSNSENPVSVSNIFDKLPETTSDSFNNKECCICLERQHEVVLPCMHSFCEQCIEEWNECHNTCPICRERLESTDDTWEISDVPEAEEISKEIRSNLMQLAEERDSTCLPS